MLEKFECELSGLSDECRLHWQKPLFAIFHAKVSAIHVDAGVGWSKTREVNPSGTVPSREFASTKYMESNPSLVDAACVGLLAGGDMTLLKCATHLGDPNHIKP